MKYIQLGLLMLVLFLHEKARADEGMWLPILLRSVEADMRNSGFKLTAEDIYSINRSSMKDAVVLFGGGCTGEVVSGDGLLFTNHHCGFGQIQSHSTVEHDYLTNGFWAMKRDQELPNPGLTVTFIIRMEDVTKKVLEGVNNKLTEAKRAEVIKANIAKVSGEITRLDHQQVVIRPFYYGNEYYSFVVETYRDVRLVGAPPQSIGNFGGDTDNWVWPRHTADFSMFRIYMSPDGKPADYSPSNVPYKPKYFFPISLKGVKENDFTMVYGFPGRTQEYLHSQSVEVIQEIEDPIRIKIRDERLALMKEDMSKSDTVRIKYASKYAGVANGWKKWKGEVRGLQRAGVLKKKQMNEETFGNIVNRDNRYVQYRGVLGKYNEIYKDYKTLKKEQVYFSEVFNALESVQLSRGVDAVLRPTDSETQVNEANKFKENAKGFFKDYNAATDKRIMKKLLQMYREGLDSVRLPEIYRTINVKFGGNIENYVNDYFATSIFTDEARLMAALDKLDAQAIKKDPAYMLTQSFISWYNANVLPTVSKADASLDSLNRIYMAGQREVMHKTKGYYPDANSTLRVTYGKASGFTPDDGVNYNYFTTLGGIFQKHETFPDNPDYKYPEKLKVVYQKKEYGPYAAANGEIRTCFLAANHTSGGNSGSPVIDGNGNLIGINFDRCWEGTMSDINYDVNQCRNISVDIRYVLFIVDKYAGAGYLLNEMRLVR